MQDIFIHKKVRINWFTEMQHALVCGTSWRHYNDDFILSDLVDQKVLNDWQVGTMNWLVDWYVYYQINIFRPLA